jgi:hypothetical protein
MPVKYFTREQYTVSIPCGEDRVFTSQPAAAKWVKLHKKRCACCKDAEAYTSIRDYRVRLSEQSNYETEQVERANHTAANRVLFEIMNS